MSDLNANAQPALGMHGPASEDSNFRRNELVDLVKGLAIIGVVWIHAGLPAAGIFRFSVPVFVGLWAFYLERSWMRGETYQRMYMGFRRLIIPYALWTLLYLSIKYTIEEVMAMPLHTLIGGQLGGFGWPGQYFFVLLFQMLFLFSLIRAVMSAKTVWLLIMIGLLFNAVATYMLSSNEVVVKLGYRVFIYWLPYAFMGIALARGYMTPNRLLLIPALGLLVLAPIELARLDEFASYIAPTVAVASVLLLAAIAPSLMPLHGLSGVAKKWSKSRLLGYAKAVVEVLGRNTFVIFVSNVLFLALARLLWGEDVNRLLAACFAIAAGFGLGATMRRLGLGVLVGEK